MQLLLLFTNLSYRLSSYRNEVKSLLRYECRRIGQCCDNPGRLSFDLKKNLSFTKYSAQSSFDNIKAVSTGPKLDHYQTSGSEAWACF